MEFEDMSESELRAAQDEIWEEEDAIPEHIDEPALAPPIGPCKPCGGSGRSGVFKEWECGMCAGTGMDYGVEIVAEHVTFGARK